MFNGKKGHKTKDQTKQQVLVECRREVNSLWMEYLKSEFLKKQPGGSNEEDPSTKGLTEQMQTCSKSGNAKVFPIGEIGEIGGSSSEADSRFGCTMS
jgi:hypothetical protein